MKTVTTVLYDLAVVALALAAAVLITVGALMAL